MRSFPSLLPLLVIAAIVLTAISRKRMLNRAQQQAAATAAAAGLELDMVPQRPPPVGFDLFSRGSRRKITTLMRVPGSADGVFRYSYTTGQKNNNVHRHTCVLLGVPFDAPHTTIGPEGFWSRLGRLVGVRDIEVESDEFNRRYRVRSDVARRHGIEPAGFFELPFAGRR